MKSMMFPYPRHIGAQWTILSTNTNLRLPYPGIYEIKGTGAGGGGGASFTTWQYDGQGGFSGIPSTITVYSRSQTTGVEISAGGAGGNIEGTTENQRGKSSTGTTNAFSLLLPAGGAGGSAAIEMNYSDSPPKITTTVYPFPIRAHSSGAFLGINTSGIAYSEDGGGGPGAVKSNSFSPSQPGSSGKSGRIDIKLVG